MKILLVKWVAVISLIAVLSSCATQRTCTSSSCSAVKKYYHSQQATPTYTEMIVIGGVAIIGGGFLYIYLANTLGSVQ